MRPAEIRLSAEFWDSVNDAPAAEVHKAIGYLTSWAINSDRYASVKISEDRDGSMSATYYDKAGNATYEMLALRAPASGSYSFHS